MTAAPTARNCAHCEELREEIRFLKREIAIDRQQSLVDRLVLHFHISPGEAQILTALYLAKGRVLTSAHLDECAPAVNVPAEDRDMKHVAVRILRLRKRLGSEAINNVWSRGYCLSEIGLLQVEEALEAQKARAA